MDKHFAVFRNKLSLYRGGLQYQFDFIVIPNEKVQTLLQPASNLLLCATTWNGQMRLLHQWKADFGVLKNKITTSIIVNQLILIRLCELTFLID